MPTSQLRKYHTPTHRCTYLVQQVRQGNLHCAILFPPDISSFKTYPACTLARINLQPRLHQTLRTLPAPQHQARSPPGTHLTQANRGVSGVQPARQVFLATRSGPSPGQPHDPNPLKPFRLGDKKPPQSSPQAPARKPISASKDLQRASKESSGVASKTAITDEVLRGPLVHSGSRPTRKKSLVIGINYVGSQHELEGCHQDVHNVREFLQAMGYSDDQESQVVMRDDQYTDPHGPYWPTGDNMLAAMDWLISEPGTVNFLHYSGHGGQVPSDDYRTSGFDDTIVPVDYETQGQIPSGVLHQTLVTKLPPDSTLFIVFDCCHSGSAVELPYVYRTDQDGNVNLLDNVEAGMRLIGSASHLLQGHLSKAKIGEAKSLLAGATDFLKATPARAQRTYGCTLDVEMTRQAQIPYEGIRAATDVRSGVAAHTTAIERQLRASAATKRWVRAGLKCPNPSLSGHQRPDERRRLAIRQI
ncbi:hypothetical protein KC340_g20 [Hortaea werneckii]|nr:hypothetical protein KC340_g20 [Hortaea werneckii]